MALIQDNAPRTFANGYLFQVPLRDLGFFATVLMGLTIGFIVFFLGTFVGIVSIMVYNSGGRHTADFAWSYTRFGLPAGTLCGTVAMLYLGSLWIRRITRRNAN